jgi:outer membrane protein assembly factor BamB
MFVGLERMFTLGSILSSPVIADGTLYVGSTDGNLYALK